MIQLTRVELRRMWFRRLVQFAMVALLAILALTFLGVNEQVRSINTDQVMLQEMFERDLADFRANRDQMIADCLEMQEQEREFSDDPTLDFGCEQMEEPRLEHYLWGPQSLAEQYRELLTGLSIPLLFLALLVGSTSTAAEFSHRTLGTWLTFEPRRDRVFGSKVAAGALASLPLSVALVTLVTLGTSALFRLHGVDHAVTSSEWTDLAWMSVRILALAFVVGAVGAAAGALVRHTAAVLGILVGYLVAVEVIFANLFGWIQSYTISRNTDAWIRDGAEWYTFTCPPLGGQCTETFHSISLAHGATVLGVLALVVVALSWARFSRGDIE